MPLETIDGWLPVVFGVGGTGLSAAGIWFGAGRMMQKLQDRIDVCEKRLDNGGVSVKEVPVLVEKVGMIQHDIVPVKEVPVLAAKLDAIQCDVREIKQNMREMVTKAVCEARHEKG